jgi:hypothetical protein
VAYSKYCALTISDHYSLSFDADACRIVREHQFTITPTYGAVVETQYHCSTLHLGHLLDIYSARNLPSIPSHRHTHQLNPPSHLLPKAYSFTASVQLFFHSNEFHNTVNFIHQPNQYVFTLPIFAPLLCSAHCSAPAFVFTYYA